jgi:hypothetical protein
MTPGGRVLRILLQLWFTFIISYWVFQIRYEQDDIVLGLTQVLGDCLPERLALNRGKTKLLF